MRRTVLAALGALLALPLVGYGIVFAASERALRRYPAVEPFVTTLPTDSASLARGAHLVRTRGCFGCHGQQLEGQVFEDEWEWVDRAVAPNLALVAREHTPAELEAAIRHGVGRDGRATWSMPSYNFRHLPDRDIAAMIAFLRSAPIVEQVLPAPRLGLRARWLLARGHEQHMATWAASVPPMVVGPEEDELLRRGEALAMTTCNECHGLDLRSSWMAGEVAPPPDLAIVASYPWDSFQTLMREGVPLDGRDLGLMRVVARDRFASFTEDELTQLYVFLQSLPSRPIPTGVFWRPDR